METKNEHAFEQNSLHFRRRIWNKSNYELEKKRVCRYIEARDWMKVTLVSDEKNIAGTARLWCNAPDVFDSMWIRKF